MHEPPHDDAAVGYQVGAFPNQRVHAAQGVLEVVVGELAVERGVHECADVGQLALSKLSRVRHAYVHHAPILHGVGDERFLAGITPTIDRPGHRAAGADMGEDFERHLEAALSSAR